MQKSFQFIFLFFFFYKITEIKIKSFECPKSIRNYKKKIMLGTSDTWSTSHLSKRTSEQAYYVISSDFKIHPETLQFTISQTTFLSCCFPVEIVKLLAKLLQVGLHLILLLILISQSQIKAQKCGISSSARYQLSLIAQRF